MRNPQPDGLSSQEEFERLCEIGDALDAAVAESPQEVEYVGRCTSAGRRDFYAYADSGLVAESLMSSVMAAFSEYEFETGFQPDPEWQLYRAFLYPAKPSLQLIKNRRVLDVLQQQGDDLTQPRPVRHFVYFNNSEQAAAFAQAAGEAQFDVVSDDPGRAEGEKQNPEAERFGVIAERVDSVDFASISNVVLELLELANSHQGDYDGWETQVQVSPDAADPDD
jgi:uncharacterized protein (TIGR01619 family)